MSRPSEQPFLWIKIDLGPAGQIGPGKIDLLRRIGETRSISAAARQMGMSYRKAWLLVDELNRMTSARLVLTHTGGNGRGGAELTDQGQALVARYEDIVAAARQAAGPQLRALAADIDPPPTPDGKRCDKLS